MGRILFFVLLVLAVYVGWRLMRAKNAAGAQPTPGRTRRPEAMVRCHVCGLNLPQSEALAAPGSDPQRWYCCEEHRKEGGARG